MFRLFIRHKVRDFDEWRAGYEAGAHLRDQNGVVGHGVHTGIDDPNDITVWHDFETREAAEAFPGLPELTEAMDRIGVEGVPDVWITRTRV